MTKQQQQEQQQQIKPDLLDNRSRSRERGYNHEDSIIKRFNELENWNAKRLGGTTIELPDLIMTNNNAGIFIAAECKSVTGDNIYIQEKQIERCFRILNMFSVYNKHYVIFPFKFSQKKRIAPSAIKKDGTRTRGKMVTSRVLKEFFLLLNPELMAYKPPKFITCNYHGNFNIKFNDKLSGNAIIIDSVKTKDYKFFDSFEKLIDYISNHMVSTKRVKRSKV